MDRPHFSNGMIRLLVCGCITSIVIGCDDGELQRQIDSTRAQTRRWADKLDKQTTVTGKYIRHEGDALPETDSWGNSLAVDYSRGGVSEIIKVTSAGPDGKFHTDDDIIEQRMTANLAGIGAGVKEGIGEVAQNAAEGMVKGTIDGVKQGIKESVPEWLKRDKNDPSADEEKEDIEETDKAN